MSAEDLPKCLNQRTLNDGWMFVYDEFNRCTIPFLNAWKDVVKKLDLTYSMVSATLNPGYAGRNDCEFLFEEGSLTKLHPGYTVPDMENIMWYMLALDGIKDYMRLGAVIMNIF